MAIYHLSAQIISRSTGRSSVAAAAYRSGEKLNDERTGLTHDYTRRKDEIVSQILAPENSPDWVYNRQELWNKVELTEVRKDAQLAREINIALPVELSKDEHIKLIHDYVKENFTSQGMVADISIHYKDNNPHAHIMLTTREIKPEGFGGKNREWNKVENLEKWRASWAGHINQALERAGINEKVDHRSLEAQGIDRIPQIHVGVHAKAMEKRGIETDRGNIYREIEEFNKSKVVELNKYKELKKQIEQQPGQQKNLTMKEREIVGKTEQIIKAPVTRESIQASIEKSLEIEQKLRDYIQSIEAKERQLYSLSFKVEALEEAQARLNEFGGIRKLLNGKEYKEAQADVEIKLNELKNYMIENRSDLEKQQRELEQAKEKIPDYGNVISEQINNRETLASARKALDNVDRRDILKEYPKAMQHMTYQEAINLKHLNESYSKTLSPEEIEQKYKDMAAEIQKYKDYTNTVFRDTSRLEKAEIYLKGYEKCKAELDRLDGKLFKVGKDYKEQYRKAETEMSNFKRLMNDCGIQDRQDYTNQLERNEKYKAGIPDVEKKISSLSPGMNLLESVVRSIVRSANTQRSQDMAEQRRLERELHPENYNKRHRDRDMELEL